MRKRQALQISTARPLPRPGKKRGPATWPDHWPVATRGKLNRRLIHPRADWIADPAAFDLPPYVRELRFHPERRWRFDYAWPDARVALEVDGGAGAFGRHSRPGGMRGDHEKANAAQLAGWIVLRCIAGEETRLATVLTLVRALAKTGAVPDCAA